MDVKEASLQILHLQPCVWKKPLGEIGCFGMENGFPVRMVDSGGSFLFVEIRDSLRMFRRKWTVTNNRVELINDLVEVWESWMEFCDQCNLDRGIRILNIKRPVGDMEDLSEVLDDGTPVIPRCFKVITAGGRIYIVMNICWF